MEIDAQRLGKVRARATPLVRLGLLIAHPLRHRGEARMVSGQGERACSAAADRSRITLAGILVDAGQVPVRNSS
jgi:hypothetical protein